MGRISRRMNLGLGTIGIWSAIVCLLIATSGCSTASWIVHQSGTADDLIITEADVDAMIDKLSLAQPKDSDAILYNKTKDRYELTPDVYKRAIKDGIIRRIQDNKISGFLEDYRPETFTGALKKDMGTAGIVILFLGILGGLFY
jgi:hypothetical protein